MASLRRFLLGAEAALFVGKLVSWWVSLASNTSGGTLAPMFLIGATMGEMLGIGFAHLFPGAGVAPGASALVAMGVTFGVGARALLTGAVFALEVTGGNNSSSRCWSRWASPISSRTASSPSGS